MKLNTFAKKNYVSIEELFKIINKYYLKISSKKINRNKNLVGFFFHELMYYYASTIYQKNLKIKNLVRFGFRNKKFLFQKNSKKRSVGIFFDIYKIISNFFFKKTLHYGFGIKLSSFQKIYILILAFIYGYKIKFVANKNYQKVYFDKFEIQKKILFSLINNLCRKYKFENKKKIKLIRDVEYFISKIRSTKKCKILNEDIFLIGSSANIFNRLAVTSHYSFNSRNINFNHENHFGFSNNLHMRFNELQYSDRYICNGFTSNNLLKNHSNYLTLNNKIPKLIFRSNKYKNIDKKIESKKGKIKDLKGLYIPTRLELDVIVSSECIDHKKYIRWQNFIMQNNENIFIKPHPKQIHSIPKFKKNRIINGELKKVINNFDYLIFDFVTSAAFGEVVTSNKQIVYFNIGLSSFTKLGENLLTQRVHKIDINFDNDFIGYKKFKKIKLTEKNNKFGNQFCNSNDNYLFIKKIFA